MPGKITTVKRIRVLGDFMMFGIFICLVIIFLHAYLNGVFNGNYTTMVDINSKNEAHVEFFLLIVILLPLFIMTTIWSFLDWKATWRARDQIRFQQYYLEPEMDRQPKKELDTILMKCSACHEVFGLTSVENDMHIECPHCNKVGFVKVPQSYERRPAGRPPKRETARDRPRMQDDFDSESRGGPQVRIIKDIRDLER